MERLGYKYLFAGRDVFRVGTQPIPIQEAGDALLTSVGSRVSMRYGDYLLRDGYHAHLPFLPPILDELVDCGEIDSDIMVDHDVPKEESDLPLASSKLQLRLLAAMEVKAERETDSRRRPGLELKAE
ncbi:hypothetical protein EVAR_93854_1 [Eumeta japonica]|uniref:Uncharacterized protein n=1 Tax=Eumeta variegata TaxID=151549 RepID=A0A4C1TWT8_EUMVA|nr:hypothetical protein EVAR_93854_1 [Eumeta japonica]